MQQRFYVFNQLIGSTETGVALASAFGPSITKDNKIRLNQGFVVVVAFKPLISKRNQNGCPVAADKDFRIRQLAFISV